VVDGVGLWAFNAGEAVGQLLGSGESRLAKALHVAAVSRLDEREWPAVAYRCAKQRRCVSEHGGKRR
jgi:hypothetical protein